MSNTVINTNVMALNSHRALTNVGIRQARASERLSTGMRINRAADDAAGLAISEKMRAQIRGLDQAERNSQDGISLVQVAEGALQEIQDITQRMRELTVQAANDTLDVQDREAIQLELEQLAEEISTIIERTEFNGIPLLETNAPGAVNVFDLSTARDSDIQSIMDFWTAGTPPLMTGTQFEAALEDVFFAAGINPAPPAADRWDELIDGGLWNETAVNILTAAVPAPATAAEVTAAWDTFAADWTPTIIPESTDIFDGDQLGLANMDSIRSFVADPANFTPANAATAITSALVDAGVMTAADAATVIGGPPTPAELQALMTQVFDNGLWNEDFHSDLMNLAVTGTPPAAVTAWNTLENNFMESNAVAPDLVNEIFIQNGANAEQRLVLTLPNFNMVGVGGPLVNLVNEFLDPSSPAGFEMGEHEDITVRLNDLDAALNEISTYRANLGAAQNRLEHTINNLQIASENTTAAESRIRDTDMAREMMAHTQANILQQAATSMLAQANQAPQAVLQLLQ